MGMAEAKETVNAENKLGRGKGGSSAGPLSLNMRYFSYCRVWGQKGA